MPLVIDDVEQYLSDNGVGTKGTSLFRSHLPTVEEAAGTVVVVIDTGGSGSDIDVPIKNPTFQIFIRATSYSAGKAKLDTIHGLLHGLIEVQLVTNGVFFYSIFAMSPGGHLGRDDNGYDLFSLNFTCKTR